MNSFKDIAIPLTRGLKIPESYISTASSPAITNETEKMQLLMLIISRLANESDDPVVKEAAAKLFSGAIAY